DDMGCPEQICRVDTMHESDDGDFVLYEDYEALQAAYEEELFCVRQDRDTHFGELMRALEQVDALKAECEKLRKDAKRYQFVRTRVSASNARGPASWTFHYYQLPRPISNPLAGPPAWEHFDAAIDSAMQGDKP